ncbi:MAG TPA: BTAD domain-containing putative transcriptional regulator [Nocardioides sp.]|nr:BTAD domain-containing putative transcriptional regulator [Nocardioides sp.]
MRIGVLGPLEIDERGARLGTRDRVVLAALAMHPGDVVSVEQLADAVWGEEPPATWSKNVQGCISRLRKLLGPDLIETAGPGYRLRVSADTVDAAEFCRASSRARELLTLHEPDRARYLASQALDLWRGRPLTELESWEPGITETHRLDEVRLELEELEVEGSLASGHHAEVLAKAAAMVEAAPLRERRWALLAQAQYLAGRQMEALRTLRRVRVVLARDLGLDPGPDLVALEQAILRQDPGLSVEPAPPTRDGVSPYPGLAPYGEEDAESFFGREEETRACLDRLASVRLLAVVGPSGSGKSSLLRAGLAAALRRDAMRVVVLNPGRHPVDTLTSAAVRADAVMLVDQAEEAFALCDDEDERHRFFEALVAHTDRGRVVLALRADHTGDLAAIPELAALVEQGLFLLGSMSADSLRQAIETPARQHGLVLEPGLTDLLVREIEGEPGALPLLSHALRETWLRHEGRTLTVAGYQASGGVRGAVAQSAESLYSNLDDAERAQLRDLVLRMVVPGPGGEPVRGEVPRRQVVVDPVQEQLIDQMVAARLVTSDADAIELAHEAVVRAWPRLRDWLEDDLEGQRTRHRLTQAAEDWAGSRSQDSDLYRGTRLAATREWVAATQPRLTDLEHRFLSASEEQAAAEEASAIELARTRGRMVRRLRYALAGAAVLLVLALITGFVAVGQTGRARDEADAARARQLSAQALGDADTPLSALLAIAAVRLDDTPQTRASLATVLARHPALVATSAQFDHSGYASGAERLVRSPDGSRLASFDSDNVVSLVDTTTGRVTARYDTDGPGPANEQFFGLGPLGFSPDGRTLAVGAQTYSSPALVLLDGRTLQPLPAQPTHLPDVRVKDRDVAFSADGRHVAASYMVLAPGTHQDSNDPIVRSEVRVWDLGHLDRRPKTIQLPWTGYGQAMALGPHGSRVYLSDPVAAYSVRSGKRLWRAHVASTWLPLDLSPDGRHLAVVPNDTGLDIALISTRHGRVERVLQGASGIVLDLTFSDDGSQVAAVSQADELLMWNRHSAHPTQTIAIDDSEGVQLNPDASRAYVSDSGEGTVVTWDLDGSASYLPLTSSHPGLVTTQVGFGLPAGDGVHVAALVPGDTHLVNERTGRVSPVPNAGNQTIFGPSSWRPDARRLALGTAKGLLQTFDDSGRLRTEARVSQDSLTGLDFAVGGENIAASDVTGHVALLDATTGSTVGSPVQLPGPAAGVTLAPDGRTAFVVTRPGPLAPGANPTFDGWALLDLETGSVLRTGRLPETGWLWDDFSPDGGRVAVGFDSGRMWIVDPHSGLPVDAPAPVHQSPIYWLGWSQDGSRILSNGVGTLELWDAATGTVQDTVTLPDGHGGVGQFRPGTKDVTIMSTGNVYTWDTSPEYAVEFACRIAGRDLTAEEWRTYVGIGPQFQVCPS